MYAQNFALINLNLKPKASYSLLIILLGSDNYAESAIIGAISSRHFILISRPREDNCLAQSTAKSRNDCKNRAELMCMMEFYLFFVPFIGCWKLTTSTINNLDGFLPAQSPSPVLHCWSMSSKQ